MTTPSDDDKFFDELMREDLASTEEDLAEQLAEQARAEGRQTVDEEWEIQVDPPRLELDQARIRRLANALLERDAG